MPLLPNFEISQFLSLYAKSKAGNLKIINWFNLTLNNLSLWKLLLASLIPAEFLIQKSVAVVEQ